MHFISFSFCTFHVNISLELGLGVTTGKLKLTSSDGNLSVPVPARASCKICRSVAAIGPLISPYSWSHSEYQPSSIAVSQDTSPVSTAGLQLHPAVVSHAWAMLGRQAVRRISLVWTCWKQDPNPKEQLPCQLKSTQCEPLQSFHTTTYSN